MMTIRPITRITGDEIFWGVFRVQDMIHIVQTCSLRDHKSRDPLDRRDSRTVRSVSHGVGDRGKDA